MNLSYSPYSVIVKALNYFSTALQINFLDNENFNYQVKEILNTNMVSSAIWKNMSRLVFQR